jgi:hypothetical protein
LWRVSRDPEGTQFSTTVSRVARFSPLFRADTVDPGGRIVLPSWYGATSRDGAVFQSVFHDIRPGDRARRVFPNQYLGRYLVPVVTVRDLVLVDLTTTGLHAIGVSRARLIDSTSRSYAFTNAIAAQLRVAAPGADGFVWVSRAHDVSRAVVLYADGGRAPAIAPHPTERAVALRAGEGLDLLRGLAVAARITVVIPG